MAELDGAVALEAGEPAVSQVGPSCCPDSVVDTLIMFAQLPLYGWLTEALSGGASAALLAVVLLAAGFYAAPLWCWNVAIAAWLWSVGAPIWLWCLFVPVAAVFQVAPWRRALLSSRILGLVQRAGLLPQISATEQEAIDAGDVWVDGELFSGRPNLHHLRNVPYPELSAEERAFLDGPAETVCAMTDDWEVYERRDLPADVWAYLKEHGFLGMIIPKRYGGLGFTAAGHSAVVHKLASRSLPLAITVMVPNSLGPAELILHGGTDEQKDHFLPRLARGEEVPAFALTEPHAGSDAASMRATGVVFRDDDGELKLRLSWDKRYITLASIATVLGLAFKLRDPDDLLGKGEDLGITCALIPTSTPGVETGRRHDPLGVPFYNCPTTGTDVVVPVSAIIGGLAGAGRGWAMLMECLAAGRGISLPATSTGGAKLAARAVGAHAAVRRQFGLPIGKFEGIEEPLARIAGMTYTLEAARRYTLGGLDSGVKPPVVTAMAKHAFTEAFRKIINDAMDVCGGSAISRGPNNVLAHPYIGAPISITVEGANILTRTLMVFGQGAIRCHPYALREIQALANGDVTAFDRALWGHVGHVVSNAVRAVTLNLTRGRLASAPCRGPAAPYWRKLSWASATFALLADAAMAGLGGDLKRKEKLTGRFADVFSRMYLAAATLRRFAHEGDRREHVPLLRWSLDSLFAEMQIAFEGILQNLRLPGLGPLPRWIALPWFRFNPIGAAPADHLGSKAARTLLAPGEVRDALTSDIHVPADPARGLGRLEHALDLCTAAEPLLRKVKDGIRSGVLPKRAPELLLDVAVERGVLQRAEADQVEAAERARAAAVSVDAFDNETWLAQGRDPATADADAEGVTA